MNLPSNQLSISPVQFVRSTAIVPLSVFHPALASRVSRINHRPAPFSIVNSYDGSGQAGYGLIQNYDDIYGNIAALGSNQLALPDPGSGTGNVFPEGNILDLTLHAGLDSGDVSSPGANCLEAGTAYNTLNGQAPTANFFVGDFCSQAPNETFPVLKSLDDPTFVSNYVRLFSDGNNIPEITEEIYQPIGGDGSWHVALYNYSASHWDDIYHAYENTNHDPDINYGWSLFETKFYPGPCPTIPTTEMTDVQVAVEPGSGDTNNYFRDVQNGDAAFAPANPNGAACLSNDNSGIGAYYTFSYTAGLYSWQVTDPHPAPSPSPKPCTNPRICGFIIKRS